MEKTTVSQNVNFYKPEVREIIEMVPILNSLRERECDLVLTKESCRLLYTTLTKIGFVSTGVQKPDIYKITVKETFANITRQRVNAIRVIMHILDVGLGSAKDIVDKTNSTTCTADQIKALREKLTSFGYDVDVLCKM